MSKSGLALINRKEILLPYPFPKYYYIPIIEPIKHSMIWEPDLPPETVTIKKQTWMLFDELPGWTETLKDREITYYPKGWYRRIE